MQLQPAQVAAFRRDGFLFLPRLFDAQETAAIDAWTEQVVSLPERPGRQMVYYEDSLTVPGERVLSRIENFCPYHREFDALLRTGKVKGAVDALFGEPSVLFKEKINFKLPGGDGFKAHQDVQAGWDSYARLHITLLVSIDATTPDNGCLEVAPGLGRGADGVELLGQMWAPLDTSAVPEAGYVAFPTEPGDALLFDSFVPHRSGPNRTDLPRRVLYVTYNRVADGDHRADYYADKRASYPPDIEREPDKQYSFRV